MKKLLALALATSAIGLCTFTPASATPQVFITTCTSTNTSGDAPSGTYDDAKGHKWAGYKQDGMPPDSLSSGGSSVTTCTTTEQVT